MLNTVLATNFYAQTINGRNKPVILGVLDPTVDEYTEAVTKFSAFAESGVNALIREAIAAMLAIDLLLPVPKPVLVQIDESFIGTINSAEIVSKLSQSIRIGFGSTKLSNGFRSWIHGEQVNSKNMQVAAEILFFDSIIQNPDRKSENPNSLFDGNDIAIFDHDLAFYTENILGWKPPWEMGALNNLINYEHIFYNSLKGRQLSFQKCVNLWKSKISDDRLSQYGNALPTEWIAQSDLSQNILKYLKNVRENIDGVENEVKRVLK